MALWTNVDEDAGKPKFLNETDASNTVGVNTQEASANGLTAGWNLKTTGSGDREGRVSHEVLVAMGSMTGDNDTIAPEITISGQPTNQSVTAPAPATFTVTASRTGTGTLAYQWQIQQEGNGAWANVTTGTGGTTNTYVTGATATGDGAGATHGDFYRVLVSLAGADTKTSVAASLTVA
jgi:hypothetical protein